MPRQSVRFDGGILKKLFFCFFAAFQLRFSAAAFQTFLMITAHDSSKFSFKIISTAPLKQLEMNVIMVFQTRGGYYE